MGDILKSMTKLLDKAVEAVRKLSMQEQDEIARTIFQFIEHDAEPESLNPAHLSAVLNGLAQAKSRTFADDADIEAAFHRFT